MGAFFLKLIMRLVGAPQRMKIEGRRVRQTSGCPWCCEPALKFDASVCMHHKLLPSVRYEHARENIRGTGTHLMKRIAIDGGE